MKISLYARAVLTVAAVAATLTAVDARTTNTPASAATACIVIGGSADTVTVDGITLSAQQATNAQAAVQVGRLQGLSSRDQAIAVMTAFTESRIRRLANPNIPQSYDYAHDGVGSDHASVGVFQQQYGPGFSWGTLPQLMDAAGSANAFLNRLRSIGNRDSLTMWAAAQKVQISAYADGSNYRPYAQFATDLVNQWSGAAFLPVQVSCDGRNTTPPEGAFVQVSTTGEVYRIAGGAPLHLTSWAPFGGPQPVTVISPAQFQTFASQPANGTDLKAAGGNQVWRVAGGAALRVANCVVGSTDFCSDAIAIDPAAVALHDHLLTVPRNGTDLIAAGSVGQVYRVAGGAALRAYQCQVGDTNFCADGVIVDGLGIVGPGNPFTTAPANGTDLIAAGSGGNVYRVAGGAALPVSSCVIGGTDFCVHGVVVDGLAIVGPNTPLTANPAPGTDLVSAADGKVWRTAGGAAFPVSACTIGTDQFCSNAVRIDGTAVTGHHGIAATPAAGTVVTTVPDNRTYTVGTRTGGAACLAPATTGTGTHLDRTGVTLPAC